MSTRLEIPEWMGARLTLVAATALVLSAVPSAASGDEYRYIVSGDPVVAASAGMTVGESANCSLDVRHHAVAESRATALTSIKNDFGFTIIIK